MVEKIKKHKFTIRPFTFFVLASIVAILISAILSFFDAQTTGLMIQTTVNEVNAYIIAVESLLSLEGFKYIVGNALTNFLSFAPLGTIIIGLIGLGVAQKTQFLKTFFTVVTNKFSKKALTFLVLLISVLGSVYINGAYVFLIPLSAILFLTNGRNPVIGVVASFAGISGGYGITALVGALDSSMAAYTSFAARLLDQEYGITIWSNIFIMVIGTILISYVGMVVTEKIIVPKIGKLKIDEDEIFIVDKLEKKGLRNGLIGVLIASLLVLYSLTQGLPFSGILLDNESYNYVNKIFGMNSPFYNGGVFIIAMILIIGSIIYGITTKTINRQTNIVKGTLDDAGNIIILIFAASQFVAIFKQTNIGPFITGTLTNLIESLNFSGIPLILVFLLVVIISNLFLTSPIAKWMIMSPVMVPMFMQANISPEFTQLIFRIGQSTTNGITPLLAYFVVFVAFVDKYNTDKDKEITVGGCIKYTIPYSIAFLGVWVLLLMTFYLIGIPLGINANPTL